MVKKEQVVVVEVGCSVSIVDVEGVPAVIEEVRMVKKQQSYG